MKRERVSLPPPRFGAAAGQVSRPGREADQRACGLPSGLLPDWRDAFLAAFSRALARYRALGVFLESCTGCGACAAACPFYLGTGDPGNLPVVRADLAREVHRRWFAPPWGWLRRLWGGAGLDEGLLRRWYTYFYQCSLCRRCARYCPLGIDTAEITLACREILAAVGLATEAGAAGAANTYRTGNSLGLDPDSWIRAHRELEAELEGETGVAIRCPVDEYGAQVLFIPPAADLVEHRGTFKGYAKVFHAAGVSWTTSTYASDAECFGAFLDYRNLRLLHRRVLEAARELKPRFIVWGESGQGWRVARNYALTLDREGWDRAEFLELKAPLHIIEWTHHHWLRGALDRVLDKEANQDLVVTCHDPCQLARSCHLLDKPRDLIRAACHRFYEMPAHTIREHTLCCGGGGGLVGSEQRALRLAGFLPRARALARVQESHGCNWVVAACQACRSSLAQGLRHYGLAYAQGGVHHLLGRALYSRGREGGGWE